MTGLQQAGYFGDGFWSAGHVLRDGAQEGWLKEDEEDAPEYLVSPFQEGTRARCAYPRVAVWWSARKASTTESYYETETSTTSDGFGNAWGAKFEEEKGRLESQGKGRIQGPGPSVKCRA